MNLGEYLQNTERGTAMQLSRDLTVPPSLISDWANGNRPVPIDRCVAIERATNGAVTRKDLRPDNWQSIWPELADGSALHVSEVVHAE